MLKRLLIHLLIMTAAIYLVALLVPGMRIKSLGTSLAVAVVYSLINFIIFRVFILFTFPLIILKYLTFGIVGLIINAVLLMWTKNLVNGFYLSGFFSAMLAALGISVVNLLLTKILVE